MDPISVLVVEDEPELLYAYCEAISCDARLRLVGAVGSCSGAGALLALAVPDVLLVDLGLPDGDGTVLIRRAIERRPDCDPLVVTVFGDDRHVIEAIRAGATGYLLKGSSRSELVDCILALRLGGSPISPSIARRLLQLMPHGEARVEPLPAAAAAPGPGAASALSAREAEILRLASKGLLFSEVGSALGISTHTVVTHVKKIYRKLAVHSRSEAVFEATQMGIL
ncbi:MAG: response regulator transcription factor [Burkholderiaceae bacterium]|jgi:DNA-binding NarL/FixJ family response regulator|nr:response regulator transcription factor [Burkholderiaceae bacterium]